LGRPPVVRSVGLAGTTGVHPALLAYAVAGCRQSMAATVSAREEPHLPGRRRCRVGAEAGRHARSRPHGTNKRSAAVNGPVPGNHSRPMAITGMGEDSFGANLIIAVDLLWWFRDARLRQSGHSLIMLRPQFRGRQPGPPRGPLQAGGKKTGGISSYSPAYFAIIIKRKGAGIWEVRVAVVRSQRVSRAVKNWPAPAFGGHPEPGNLGRVTGRAAKRWGAAGDRMSIRISPAPGPATGGFSPARPTRTKLWPKVNVWSFRALQHEERPGASRPGPFPAGPAESIDTQRQLRLEDPAR